MVYQEKLGLISTHLEISFLLLCKYIYKHITIFHYTSKASFYCALVVYDFNLLSLVETFHG